MCRPANPRSGAAGWLRSDDLRPSARRGVLHGPRDRHEPRRGAADVRLRQRGKIVQLRGLDEDRAHDRSALYVGVESERVVSRCGCETRFQGLSRDGKTS